MKVAILGAGLTGVYLAKRLKELGAQVRVLEAAGRVGGLCRTERRGAHAWDLGPHAFYSKNPAALGYYRALPLSYGERDRDVRVAHRSGGRLVDVAYPFENGLADLPLPERWECVRGYLAAAWKRSGNGFKNLQDWIDRGLGAGIARQFMNPYNAKIWNHPLDGISMALVSGKIDPETPWKVIRQALFRGTVGRAYQAHFIYPAEGAGAIPETIAAGLEDAVSLGWKVARLAQDGAGWKAVSARGETACAEAVVSTIPIPDLLTALDEPALKPLSSSFVWNDTCFVAVGLKESAVLGRFAPCHWVFFAGAEVFYRLTLMHNFAGGRPPTIVAEITRKGEAARTAPEELAARVVRDLLAAGIVRGESDVAFADARLEPHTYPIPTIGMAEARRKLEEALEPRGVHLLGRNGRWDYINTDGVFLAVEVFVQRRGGELAARR